jgi:hypothetical protein
MSFYLSQERERGVVGAYQNYLKYLHDHQKQFPSSAFGLGTALWYQDANDHKCPHDSWLENFSIRESANENGERNVAIQIRLLAAYGDGFIEFSYPKVFGYNLNLPACEKGHRDWLYDEFRLSKNGHVIHEIEWRGDHSNWMIEASDVHYRWIPK